MVRQLQELIIPAAVSISFFDATFFAIAGVFHFSGREIALGIGAGAAGGLFVLGAILLQTMRSAREQSAAAQRANRD